MPHDKLSQLWVPHKTIQSINLLNSVALTAHLVLLQVSNNHYYLEGKKNWPLQVSLSL